MKKTPTQVVNDLKLEHIAPLGNNLDRLPTQIDDTNIKDEDNRMNTSLDVPAELRSNDTDIANMYRQIITYQDKKGHDKPPGRWENLDQRFAKRLFCETMKCSLLNWQVSSHGVDEDVSKIEVQRVIRFVEHLSYYPEVFKGKRKSPPTFDELLQELQDKLKQLLQKCALDENELKCRKMLAEIIKFSDSFRDNALRVMLLGVTSNHTELFQSSCNEPVSIGALSRMLSNSAPSFWATDVGQILYALLIRGEPDGFTALASVWIYRFRHRAVQRLDYGSSLEAVRVFQERARRRCAVLTSSDGQPQNNRRPWHPGFFGVWNQMNDIVARHDRLQLSALAAAATIETEDCGPFAAASSHDDHVDVSSATGGADGEQGSAAHANQQLRLEIDKVLEKWSSGLMDNSGVAVPFRRSDLLRLVLSLAFKLSDVMLANRHVMSDVRKLTSGGGTETTFAAIHALREGSKFSRLLLTSMTLFTECASQIDAAVHEERSKASRNRTKIPGQLVAMQRIYFESYLQCKNLLQRIKDNWQQLECLKDCQRIASWRLQVRASAYGRLAARPSPTPAIRWVSPSQASSSTDTVSGSVQLEVESEEPSEDASVAIAHDDTVNEEPSEDSSVASAHDDAVNEEPSEDSSVAIAHDDAVKWMWNDPNYAVFGKRLAHKDPLRWSNTQSPMETITDLKTPRNSMETTRERKVRVQVFRKGQLLKEAVYRTQAEAIAALSDR